MSYRFPFALLGFLLSFSVSSQSIISDFLQQKLQNNPSKTQRIQIYLRDRLDTRELNRQFDQNSIPNQERIQSLNLSLKSKAENAGIILPIQRLSSEKLL